MSLFYYDREGNKLNVREWTALFSDEDYRQVALTEGCGRVVSTVWLGTAHTWGNLEPRIFESMVFSEQGNAIDQVRYATEVEALEGHERLCSDHAYVLDRIVTELKESDEVVDDSGSSCASEAAG